MIQEVEIIYRRLDEEIQQQDALCCACGQCCDFESFGHRLYVTTPELVYFLHHIGSEIQPMTGAVCPYRVNGKCSVYPYRFSGCRIFSCKGDAETQNAISERIITIFKSLCEKNSVSYRYVYLRDGLEMLLENDEFNISNL
jgi:hypothetical protein